MTQTSKRFLLVGSLLRPADLLEYKTKIEHRDDIQYPFYNDFEGYKEVEDKAVADVVKEQLAHDLPEVTDGEFSKSLWHLDFYWGLDGVRRFIAENGYFFRDNDEAQSDYETRKDIGIEINSKICCKHHAFIDHYERLNKLVPEGKTLKQCVVSPSHFYGELRLQGQVGGKVYQTNKELRDDLVEAYKAFLDLFVKAGGKIIQFDDCLWELFASDNTNSPFAGGGAESTGLEFANELIDINNEVIDYAHGLGLKVYTHNCRGNYDSRHFSSGSYESIANLFLEKQKYDRFYLEWDDERAGNLSALSVFKDRPEVEVVLGFLSSKTRTLEDEDRIKGLLEEATKYLPKENLYLSHQCGFASCDGGNELSVEEQWAKIKQGQKIALDFWGE
ncbi:MAG: 5-methyltetrahydropteroyltriglutamate--homocysteine methyltransferase [Gemella sp.]|nr:5-methyltetrahydropteroyltriglutamate--homocysteine methyltransferase [Gemella sp.]